MLVSSGFSSVRRVVSVLTVEVLGQAAWQNWVWPGVQIWLRSWHDGVQSCSWMRIMRANSRKREKKKERDRKRGDQTHLLISLSTFIMYSCCGRSNCILFFSMQKKCRDNFLISASPYTPAVSSKQLQTFSLYRIFPCNIKCSRCAPCLVSEVCCLFFLQFEWHLLPDSVSDIRLYAEGQNDLGINISPCSQC